MPIQNNDQRQVRPAQPRTAAPVSRPAPNRRPPEYGVSLGARPQPQNRQPQRRPAQEQRPAEPKRPRSRWLSAIIMVLATIGGCIFLSIFILQSASDMLGLNQPDKQIEVAVPDKNNLASISTMLYEKGVVSQPFTFRFYAGLKLNDEDIKSGTYIMNSNFAYEQIILALTTGNTKKEEVRVTFIEGWTLYEIAMKLEENKVCSADEFLEYMNKGTGIDYEFMNQVPNSPFRYRKLEGYAFPDTYDFYVGMEVPAVADKFLNNLNKKITEDMRAQMREKNLSFDEMLILASIVQKEAGDKLEMRMVASVFENRLAAPEAYPSLQSDVTIHYIEKFIKPFLDRDNQAMYDEYNTYKCDGLPVGPVCNPGLDAINAVLDPEKSGYYFFVTDDAGTYYYAKNLQQHNANCAKAEKVGGENTHGTATMSDVQ